MSRPKYLLLPVSLALFAVALATAVGTSSADADGPQSGAASIGQMRAACLSGDLDGMEAAMSALSPEAWQSMHSAMPAYHMAHMGANGMGSMMGASMPGGMAGMH